MIQQILFTGLLFFTLFSCSDSPETKENAKPIHKSSKRALQKPLERTVQKKQEYTISVTKIDSLEFYRIRKDIHPKEETPEKITDFLHAKKQLKGIVEFGEGQFSQSVKKIRFRNGKVFNPFNRDDCFFVAYFPKEDILLCEGGHSTDVSFNLKNGLETEDTGNPDVIVSSSSKKRRLNGDFEGQECYHYFIQERINGEYVKIIELSNDFESLTTKWLCTVRTAFWSTDDRYLYLSTVSYMEEQMKYTYYRVEPVVKHTGK